MKINLNCSCANLPQVQNFIQFYVIALGWCCTQQYCKLVMKYEVYYHFFQQ